MCIVDYFNTITTTRCLDLREASQNGKWSRNEAKIGNSSESWEDIFFSVLLYTNRSFFDETDTEQIQIQMCGNSTF